MRNKFKWVTAVVALVGAGNCFAAIIDNCPPIPTLFVEPAPDGYIFKAYNSDLAEFKSEKLSYFQSNDPTKTQKTLIPLAWLRIASRFYPQAKVLVCTYRMLGFNHEEVFLKLTNRGYYSL